MTIQGNQDKKAKRASLDIREMTIDDLADVFHLGEQLFEANKNPNLYRTWDEYEIIELYHVEPEFCLVAEDDDKIIGFALGTTITKNRSAWKYGYLVWLGVNPAYQKQGIAEKLFKRFRELMLHEGVRMLLVDTAAENLASLRFFRKMGFSHPQQHIYLTLNLAAEQQRMKKKRNGESTKLSADKALVAKPQTDKHDD